MFRLGMRAAHRMTQCMKLLRPAALVTGKQLPCSLTHRKCRTNNSLIFFGGRLIPLIRTDSLLIRAISTLLQFIIILKTSATLLKFQNNSSNSQGSFMIHLQQRSNRLLPFSRQRRNISSITKRILCSISCTSEDPVARGISKNSGGPESNDFERPIS